MSEHDIYRVLVTGAAPTSPAAARPNIRTSTSRRIARRWAAERRAIEAGAS
jgi:hypothetical protein